MKSKRKKTDIDQIRGLLKFIEKAEKLKTVLRHSWTNMSSRQESVADHTWMTTLLAVMFYKNLSVRVDLVKLLKILIVHDLAEAVVGDIPAFEDSKRKTIKKRVERQGMQKLLRSLGDEKSAKEILSLWLEYETEKTREAKLAKTLDKLEAVLQHNIADITTWEQGDYNIQPFYHQERFNTDDFLRAFKEEVDRQTMVKITKAKTLNRVKPEHIELWRGLKSKANGKP